MSWVNPVAGRISSKFGNRKHPVTGVYSLHGGTDIAAATGTAVKAAAAGTVTAVATGAISGRIVELDHGGGIKTRYHHLSAQLVKVGQQVKTGESIARVGATGRVTGAHLHFEVHRNGTKIDPQPFMRARGVELGTNKKITPSTGGALRRGDRSPAVRVLQKGLNKAFPAYSKLKVDESFGPATEKVVKEFQRRTGLTVDGIVGPATTAELAKHGIVLNTSKPAPAPKPQPKPASGTLARGSKGARVGKLQRGLNKAFPAYSKLKVDNSFGPATGKVVAEFQRRSGLKVDGRVGPATTKELAKHGVKI